MVRRRALRRARVRVDREHLGTELGQHRRHHDRRGAGRVVEHDLERRFLEARAVDALLERGRVELDRSGREHDVADVARERAAVVLAVTAAARCLRCVPSSMSRPSASKKRSSTLSASSGASRTVIPPRDSPLRTWKRVSGHGRELDVLDVGAGEVETGDHRALQRAGDPAGVAARGDDRARLQRRAVGHRGAHRDLGGDRRRSPGPGSPAGRTACGRPRLSQTIDEFTTASASTVLNG